MCKHQQISASILCKFLLKLTKADIVLAVAEAEGGTVLSQSMEFSSLLAKCPMSTFWTYDDEAFAWCFLPLAWLHNAETPITDMSNFILQRKQQALSAFLVLLVQLLKAGSESHSS